MDINKAIRKQKKSYKGFMLAMCFIFFMLPFVLYLSRKMTPFFIIYLVVIEVMIFLSILARSHNEKLEFQCDSAKLKIRDGLLNHGYNLACNKVILVHTEKREKDIQIIIITTSRFRNKRIKEIDKEFLKEYAYLSQEYLRIKKLYPENMYYYMIVKNGGYYKYKLLAELYKNSVKAVYTDEAIENIKKAHI
jgi:hypothetical protein